MLTKAKSIISSLFTDSLFIFHLSPKDQTGTITIFIYLPLNLCQRLSSTAHVPTCLFFLNAFQDNLLKRCKIKFSLKYLDTILIYKNRLKLYSKSREIFGNFLITHYLYHQDIMRNEKKISKEIPLNFNSLISFY